MISFIAGPYDVASRFHLRREGEYFKCLLERFTLIILPQPARSVNAGNGSARPPGIICTFTPFADLCFYTFSFIVADLADKGGLGSALCRRIVLLQLLLLLLL
jgi:hypothetical protein